MHIDDAEGDEDHDRDNRERVGYMVIDLPVSDDEKSALVFALQRDTPFHAELATQSMISVYRTCDDEGESDGEGAA